MNASKELSTSDEIAEAVIQDRKSFSIVWIVPLVAVFIGGWLVYKTVSEKGPTIEITFKAAEGLESGKTKIKYKDVEIGKIETIELSENLDNVIITAELVKGAERYLNTNTKFWVVKARIAAREVSGLETLFSGAYIGIEPGQEGAPARKFKGLEKPPIVTRDLPGRHFILKADTLGSLEIGSAVYYRKIEVGKVVDYELKPDGKFIDIEIFINEPYHKMVFRTTRFWNASGLDISIDANGIQVNTESLVSMLIGGIAFDTPTTIEPNMPAEVGFEFKLYRDKKAIFEQTYSYRVPYLVYFDGSIKGLIVEAPVEFRGIRIGKVVDIRLEFLVDKATFRVPVLIEIEPERITMIGNQEKLGNIDKGFQLLIEKGLRAQLKVSSMLTGSLYVDLDIHPDAPPATLIKEGGYIVLPSIPTPLEEITTSIAHFLKRLESFPIEQIGSDLQKTIKSTQQLVTSSELTEAMKSLNKTLKQTEMLAENLNQNVAPEIKKMIKKLHQTFDTVDQMVQNDSIVMVELHQALRELSRAARAVHDLADYLERNPDALIYGKGNE